MAATDLMIPERLLQGRENRVKSEKMIESVKENDEEMNEDDQRSV